MDRVVALVTAGRLCDCQTSITGWAGWIIVASRSRRCGELRAFPAVRPRRVTHLPRHDHREVKLMESSSWRWNLAVPVALVVAALLAVIIGIVLIPSRREDIGFEIAKAAVQAIPFVILSIGVGLFLRWSEGSREDRRLSDEHRRKIFDEVVTAYNRIKGTRRWLRAAGYLDITTGSLSAERLAELDRRMEALSDAELELEKVKREVELHPHVFTHAVDLVRDLTQVTRYLRGVVKDWEKSELTVDDGVRHVATWTGLQGFLRKAGTEGATFKECASDPMDAVVKALLSDLLPGTRRAA